MNKEINHWCKVCGVGYFACNDCDRKEFITWRSVACSPKHFQAYCILHDFDSGMLDKDKAKEHLEPLVDAGAMENYPEPTRGLLMNIFAKDEKKNAKQKQKKAVETQEELHEPNENAE